MSGLFGILGNSVSALRTQTAAIDIAGRNLANVNNPAYARQRLVFGSRGVVQTPYGPQSLAIEAVGLKNFRDNLIDNQILREQFHTQSLETQSRLLHQTLASLESGIFQSSTGVDTIGSGTAVPKGLNDMLDSFFNAFQSFAAQPTSPVEKQFLLDRTDALITRFHLLNDHLADSALGTPVTTNSLTRQIDEEVGRVNELLQQIATLNKQIGSLEIGQPKSALDLRDQRQARLEELAGYLDFTHEEDASGQVNIKARDTLANEVDLVVQSVYQGTISRNGATYEFTPTSGPTVTLDLNGGKLQGFLEVGATVQSLLDDFDSFVANLVTSVNTAYNSPVNGNFFDPAGTTTGTIARSVTLATLRAGDLGGPSGDNRNALAVAALSTDHTFSGNGTPSLTLSRIVTGFAQTVGSVDNRWEDSRLLHQTLKNTRDSAIAVSVDEEAADLIRAQRAFQAAGKVFTIVDQLLDRVINDFAR